MGDLVDVGHLLREGVVERERIGCSAERIRGRSGERIRRRGRGERVRGRSTERVGRRRCGSGERACPRSLGARSSGDGHRLGALEHDLRPADLQLIARVDLALVDARPVHHRARLIAEIDEGDVVGRRYLDDGVHARGKLVVDAQMALRVLAHLHDVLRHSLTTDERLVLVERKCESDLLLAFHHLDPAFPSTCATGKSAMRPLSE